MSYKETMENMSKSMGVTSIILLLIDAAIMTVGAVFCIGIPQSRVIGIGGAVFFGLELIQFIVMLRYTVTNEQSE